MSRNLLVLSLLLFAASAAAQDAPPPAPSTGGCPKPAQAADKSPEGDTAPAQRPGEPAPVRPRATGNAPRGGGAPRWHSMLPGMIR